MLVFCAISLSWSALLRADDAAQPQKKSPYQQNKASLVLRWIDAHGHISPGGSVNKMEWVWSRDREDDSIESPALRLWIKSQLPPGLSPRKTTGHDATLVESSQETESRLFVIDVRGSHATLDVEFEDKQGRLNEMTLSINAMTTKPYILVRPECGKIDLRFLVHKANASHLFVGLSCFDRGDSIDIYFFRSKDSAWNQSAGLARFDPENRLTTYKYHAAKPKKQVVYSQRLFRIGTADESGNKTEYSVFYNPKKSPELFYWAAGLGTTFYSYNEETSGIHLSQLSLTGKVSVGYRLIPKVLDVAFNGFSTIISPFSSTTPDGFPSARFYGLNGRIGYRLPVGLGATEFMFLTGWYVWGMFVNSSDANKDYGIRALSGPQLFLTMINSQTGHPGWWSYIKLAMISDPVRVTALGNRELAIGGGIELSAHEAKPFSLTFDIAQAQFEASDKSNMMKLFSMTLGLQKAF